MISFPTSAQELTGGEATRRYIDLLTGSQDSELAFRTFCDDKAHRSAGQNFTGSLAQFGREFERAQSEGHGVFAVVNGGGHRDAEITEVRAVFVDADGVPLEDTNWHVTPDFIVVRDDTHWHAYWLVSSIDVSEFRTIQKRLAKHYGTDPNVCNPSRVMRLPGYMHLKDPANPKPVTVMDLTGGSMGDCYRALNGYSAERICAGLSKLEARPEQSQIRNGHGSPITLKQFREILSYVDPTMQGEHQKWAGMTLAIVHGELPIVDQEPIDWVQLANDFNSGKLWRERTNDQSFVVSTYKGRDEMLRSAAGRQREVGPVITLGTFYQLAREGGFKGPSSDEMAVFDMLEANTVSDANEEAAPDVYPCYSIRELDKLPAPRWLIKGLIPEDALSMLYGASGSLKTFFALDIVLSGAAKGQWAEGEGAENLHGFKIARPLRAAFIAGEGARGLKKRAGAWQKKHGLEESDIPVFVIPMMPRFGSDADIAKLIRTIRKKVGSVDLVVVDTAMRASSGLNLNVPADSQLLIDACERIQHELGASVILIHHTGKDRDKGPLGAENLKAAVHTVERIDLVESSPGQRTISITQEKSKDSDLRAPIYMRASNEMIGVDSDGNDVSSLVLTRCEPPAALKQSSDYERFHVARRIIREHSDSGGIPMRPLAEALAQAVSPEPLSGETLARRTEVMRKWLTREAELGQLKPYAERVGKGPKAAWRFMDSSVVLPQLAA